MDEQQNIIINILKEKELNEFSVVKEYLTTAADGKNYNVLILDATWQLQTCVVTYIAKRLIKVNHRYFVVFSYC